MEDLARLLASYDASGDYWRLRKDGSLEYDGRATLTDEEGNVLMSYQQMGLRSDNSIEGALAFLLTGKNDEAGAALARRYMIEAGMEHTNKGRPVNEWRWKDGDKGTITLANMGKRIKLFDKIHTIGTTMVPQLFAGLFDYQTDVQASYLLRNLDPTKDLASQKGVYEGVKALERMRHVISGGVVQIILGANTELKERYDKLLDAKVNFYLSRTAFLEDGILSIGRDVRLSDGQDFGSRHPGTYPSTDDIHVGGDFVFEIPGTIKGQPVVLPFSGKVVDNFWNDGGGNIVRVEYGFQFEGSFISQHLFGQSVHLENKGILSEGAVYKAGTVLGYVGKSGKNCTGYHLHQEFFIKGKVDSKEEQLKLDLIFGNWNKRVPEDTIFSHSNSIVNLNYRGNSNDNRTYFNSVKYLEQIYGRKIVWQTGGSR
jgi:murein DD-endopeptidase MepM/ murein hydrolase activator NlpD